MSHQGNAPDLTPQQREAVDFPGSGRLKITAGAGSGKTEVLTHRIKALIETRGIPPSEIVAITYTNKAAASMKSRLAGKRQIPPRVLRGLQVSTFHSFLARSIKEDPFGAGIAPGFAIITENDRRIILSHLLDQFRETFSQRLLSSEEGFEPATADALTREFPHLLGQIRRFLLSPRQFYQRSRRLQKTFSAAIPEQRVLEWLYRFYLTYLQELDKRRFLDFDEILLRGQRLLIDLQNQGILSGRRVFLIDEFQDNNQEQLGIISLFLRENRGHLTVVGDPKQSIYRFQGAEVETFTRFPGATELELNENFRSYEEILQFADTFINTGQTDPRFLKAHLGASPRLHPLCCLTTQDRNPRPQAEMVASMINGLTKGGLRLKKTDRPLTFGDIAIIVGSVRKSSKPLEDALSAAKIPFVLSGGLGFYDLSEIRDVVSFLRLLSNPNDDFSLLKILSGPLYGLPDSVLARMAVKGRTEKTPLLLHILSLAESDLPEKAAEFRRLFVELRGRVSTMRLLDLVYRLVDDGGFREYAVSQKDELRRRRMENNLGKFISIVRAFESRGIFSALRDFLQYLDRVLKSDIDEDEAGLGLADSEAVKIMTIHKAKGLEFPVVFLPFLKNREFRFNDRMQFTRDNGVLLKPSEKDPDHPFWKWRTAEKEAHDQEERRKMYVAITRAEELLVISGQNNPEKPGHLAEMMQILEENPRVGKARPLDSWSEISLNWLQSGCGEAAQTPVIATPAPDPEILRSAIQSLGQFLAFPCEAKLLDGHPPDANDARQAATLTTSGGATLTRHALSGETCSLADLATYEDCPRRYFLRKRLITHFDEGDVNHLATLGNLIHRTLRLYHDQTGQPHDSEERFHNLLKHAQKLLPLHSFPDESFWNRAQRTLRQYSQSPLAGPGAWLLEAELNVRLQAPSGPFYLRGFADRVDKTGSETRVIDYKVRPFSESAHKSYARQMALYMAAARQGVLGDMGVLNFPEIVVAYLTEASIHIVPVEPNVPQFETWAINLVERIRQDRSWHPTDDPPCEDCHYIGMCFKPRQS